MAQQAKNFIVIDDDPVNNRICKIIIERLNPQHVINCFDDSQEAVDYLLQSFAKESGNTIMLLDINMPGLSGWDVLDHFEQLEATVRDQLAVYILSSSVDAYDKKKADENRFVAGYIEKPLTMERVKQLLEPA